jgi:2-haloacid dehalogenase
MSTITDSIAALVFDVFGTCVDWRGSVIGELEAYGGARGISADWPALADEWRRDGYIGAIARFHAGAIPFTGSDRLFRVKLEELLPRYGVPNASQSEIGELTLAWRRLDPWPDTVAGLRRLKQQFVIAPLSNGSFPTLTAMAKRAEMPWDCIISTELRRTFKPAREAFQLALELLDMEPRQVMLVAAHQDDLRGGQAVGLRTALVPRPLGWGPGAGPLAAPDPWFDMVAADFEALADQLGC